MTVAEHDLATRHRAAQERLEGIVRRIEAAGSAEPGLVLDLLGALRRHLDWEERVLSRDRSRGGLPAPAEFGGPSGHRAG